MKYLSLKQNILILECICAICLNTAIIILIFSEFKRDEIEGDFGLTVDSNHILNNSSSFKYKSSLLTTRNNVKIAVPLKYLSNF